MRKCSLDTPPLSRNRSRIHRALRQLRLRRGCECGGAGGGDLDDLTRFLAILATLLGCQGIDEFRALLPAALEFGITPVEVKEIVHQSTAYLGIGRILPFLRITNEVLTEHGVGLPLPKQATTTPDTRPEAGIKIQVDFFGEGMCGFWQSGPEQTRHINR